MVKETKNYENLESPLTELEKLRGTKIRINGLSPAEVSKFWSQVEEMAMEAIMDEFTDYRRARRESKIFNSTPATTMGPLRETMNKLKDK